ncbi:MAG: 30S ribosomal protein S9 [Deltaproteobacteria bacterium]|nr:30S ribosomal protein S9 [Deltaproteobacteria bacterium]MBW2541215.1 30S ribosomal protein S9 [Deltaproteobacteria bacterium]
MAELQTVQATGKRKTAIAQVRMRPGTGIITVNNKPMNEYFTRESQCLLIKEALETVSMQERYDVSANCKGGGSSGQAGALRHGIARALEKIDSELRGQLKRKGFLTRDARKKERKKYGQKGARARFQFSKR